MISAYTASMPERVHILQKAIQSILPQVDFMQVVLNNFTYTPDFLHSDKIRILHSDNRLEDGSRFIDIESAKPGFTLVFDDDIIYPKNYVQHLIEIAEGRSVMVTPMGKILKPRPIKSYYVDIARAFRAFETIDKDYVCEVPGACGILWDNRIVKVQESDMLIPNSDICLAKFCKDNEVTPLVVAHASDWLKSIWHEAKKAPSIFGKYRKNDGRLTEFVNEHL